MYLKSLTVLGFKSFADKTTLNFQPGVSAIVGPNGCGKSNVSDAIRWVLGEQSAKAMRGSEMADVIFSGTDGRKPLGMAEVSLTIGGVDEEHLRAAGVELAYSEVTLTRRVFRDGVSEYFVNKTPCRLKDVQQLFMGTGVGRASYSIMAQGNITQILSSKPEDRRMIFEEAAGITKFKSQKREALRKLEYTDQNLLRVEDLIREVKRQIGSLQRQAGKARRFKQLSQELQHVDTQLARHEFDQLQVGIRERQMTSERLRAEMEHASASVLRSEEELGGLRERFSALEHQISEMQQRGVALKGQADQHQARIQFNDERLLEIQRQQGAALGDIAQAEERGLAAEQERSAVSIRLSETESELKRHQSELQSRQDALRNLEEEMRQNQEALRLAQADAFALAQEFTRARNEITALDLLKQGNSVRLEKLSAEKVQLEEERGRLESRLADFAANVEAGKLNAKTTRGSLEERQRRLADLHGEITDASLEQESSLQQLAEQRSRLDVLEQLQAGHEGFSAGALAALKGARNVLGSLAEKIRVPDPYVAAIECALGHHLQLVLTEKPESAQEILSDLYAGRKGRASIAALALSGNARSEHDGNGESGSPALVNLNGKPLPAIAVVETEESVRPLLQRLLGMTRIVRDLDAATAAWRDSEGAFNYVTLEGELLSRHGIFTGGRANGNGSDQQAPASILARKNQVEDLRRSLTSLQTQVAAFSRRKGALQSEQTELQAGLQQAQTDLREQEVAIATREGEFNALQDSRRLLLQKIETVVYEIQSLAATEREGVEKRATFASQVGELETREKAGQAAVKDMTAVLERLRQERDAATASLTECKVALATQEQLCASFRQQLQPLEERIRELAELAERRRTEISSFVTRKAQAETEVAESRRQIERLQIEREQVNEQVAELVARKNSQEAEIDARDEGLREERRRLGELQQQRSVLDVELAQKNMSVQNLRDRIQQKYHVNLDDVRSECITITYADEGPAKIQTLTPEEMAAAGAATDWKAVADQLTALQTRIDEMGPVNLVAIEEYEETEQRHQFLTRQYTDLVQAREQLLEVINRINTQTRQMFAETFERIRANFRAMFTEVFGGGKADLILLDQNDVLESGIDIVARPPGKQLQTISLLSGGEQTMTAVSLLFSIYQVKPSPFCVLDELDAPLDESNINRFVRILQRFLAHSQFIIITHNKRTIGMADILYGVTMEEQGVSKIVSVKFHKADETVIDHKPMSLETPTAEPPVDEEEDAPHKPEETLELMMAK